LFRQNLPGAAHEVMLSATLRVLNGAGHLALIIDFLETGFEDLHMDLAD
jgi:hypothetical protein